MVYLKCQECHERPATLHFTKIINGQKNEMHLCEKCAREKGEMISGTSNFSMNSLLSGLLNFDYTLSESSNAFSQNQTLKCEKCGMTYNQFSQRGRFGCSNCYKTFNSKIDPILRRVHSGNTTHDGKIPKRIGGNIHIQREIKQLKEEMQQSVTHEEFEQAARIRDKVRELEQKLADAGEGGRE